MERSLQDSADDSLIDGVRLDWGWGDEPGPVGRTPPDNDGLPTIGQQLFRDVMGRFVTGVTVITADSGGRPVGMTAQSFVSLSLNPPLVMVCPARYSPTWKKIEAGGELCINVLARDQEQVSRRFASRVHDRFDGIEWSRAPKTGSPLLSGVNAWADCSLHAVHPGGDHVIAVCRVLAMGAHRKDAAPLVFYCGTYGEVVVSTSVPTL